MPSKPLAYESLKCVLQYMEPNKRFRIANHCPSTRTADRATPLKIHKLELKRGEVKVNNTTYRVTIHQKCHNGGEPWRTHPMNYELDSYGFMDLSDEKTLTPGDVKFGRVVENLPEYETLEYLENQIRMFEQPLQNELNAPPGSVEAREMFAKAVLKRNRAALDAFHMRRDGVPSPSENFVQLSVTSGSNTHIEDCRHNKKYSVAMKQLGKFLFGGRRCVVLVEELRLVGSHVLRLPEGVKFQIDKLCFRGDVSSNLIALNPIIHHSSYPFQHLQINQLSPEDTNNEIVNSAKLLEISNFSDFPILPEILKLRNQRVHVAFLWLPLNVISEILQNWVTTLRPIGTYYTINFRFFPTVMRVEMVHMIRLHHNGVVDKNGCSVIPMTETAEIEVYCINDLQNTEEGTVVIMVVPVK